MGRLTLGKLVKDQFMDIPPVSEYKTDLSGKTVVVVGASSGIGLETTRHFARMNPERLIMACRDIGKAQKALQTVRDATSCQSLEVWHIDLACFQTIRAFADKYEKEGGGHLDLLVMNAGMQSFTFKQTVDAWERLLQTNHLGTSYLTLLLLPFLSKSLKSPPTPRIVIVTSDSHYMLTHLVEANSPQILEKLNDKQYGTKMPEVMRNRYLVTKLFNIFFVRSLASRLPTPASSAPRLTVTAVNPGWCASDINREVKWTLHGCMLSVLFYIFARTTEVGSRTIVWAALGGKDSGGQVHGKYTSSCRVEEESDYAISDEGRLVEERVWKETIEVLRNIDHRVEDIIQEYLCKLDDVSK